MHIRPELAVAHLHRGVLPQRLRPDKITGQMPELEHHALFALRMLETQMMVVPIGAQVDQRIALGHHRGDHRTDQQIVDLLVVQHLVEPLPASLDELTEHLVQLFTQLRLLPQFPRPHSTTEPYPRGVAGTSVPITRPSSRNDGRPNKNSAHAPNQRSRSQPDLHCLSTACGAANPSTARVTVNILI